MKKIFQSFGVTSRTRKNNVKRSLHWTLALLLFLSITQVSAFGATISDDFESDAVGSFPSGWLDVGEVDPGSTAPDPSATVVLTTDAFGNPTNALSIPDAFAASQGIYQTIPVSRFVNISVDIRVDRFSDNQDAWPPSDWPIDITLSQLQGQKDLAHVPSMGVYTSSATQSWHGFIFGTDGTRFLPDFGLDVNLSTWYHVKLALDTVKGTMNTKITDIAAGTLLLDRDDTTPGWTEQDGLFDAIAFFDGEISAENFTNLVVIDNISCNYIDFVVDIDIKPGSYPNVINLSSAGVVPVAILSSQTFDALTVNPDSITLAGASIRLIGKSDKTLCHPTDVNNDGQLDLLCQVETEELLLQEGDSEATLEATTYDGKHIRGVDSVSFVPDN